MPRYLVKGGSVLTFTKENSIIDNGAVIVNGDSIEEVGKEEALRKKGRFESEIGSENFIVMPGLTNAHYHAGNAFRNGFQDAPLEKWLLTIHNALSRASEEAIFNSTQYYGCEMIKAGITSCVDNKSILPLIENGVEPIIKAYSELGIRAAIAPIAKNQSAYVHGDDKAFLSSLPPELGERARKSQFSRQYITEDEYIEAMEIIFKRYDGFAGGRIKVFLSPYGPQWCSDSMLLKIKRAANEWNTGIHMHLLETRYEMQYAFKAYGKTAVSHLCELDFLAEEVSCAHAIWMTDDDIKKFGDSGANAVHNPASNLRLGSGIARIRHMLDNGVKVAIGTDGLSSAGTNDLLSDLRLADQLQRIPGITSHRIDSTTWFEMATICGAKASSFGKICGTLEAGKKADMILIRKERIFSPYVCGDLPITDILLQLALGTDVDTVIINGRPVMQSREILTINEISLLQRLTSSFEGILISFRSNFPLIKALESHVETFFSKWDEEQLEGGYLYNTK